jgi:hypothetical protein
MRSGARELPKWKKDATEFTVGVSYDERRGAQAYIPKPIAEHLGNPKAITYRIKGKKVEVEAEKRSTSN